MHLSNPIMEGVRIIASMRPTFAGQWTSKVRKFLAGNGAENGEFHCTVRGYVSYFTDKEDGQTYRITIEPVSAEVASKAQPVAEAAL